MKVDTISFELKETTTLTFPGDVGSISGLRVSMDFYLLVVKIKTFLR